MRILLLLIMLTFGRDPWTKPEFGTPLDPDYPGFAQGMPAAFWAMNDPAGSKQIFDCSGHGNTGTLNGGVSWVGGSGGMALKFDGTGEVDSKSSIAFTSPKFTLAIRVYSTAFNTNFGIVAFCGGGEWFISQDGATGKVSFSAGSVGNVVNSTKAVFNDATWHLLVFTYDGVTQSVYVDGALNASSTISLSFTSQSLPIILGGRGNGAQFFTGLMDFASYFPYALTPSQVLSLYNSPRQMFGGREVVVAAPSTPRSFGGILSGGGLGGGILTGGRMAA